MSDEAKPFAWAVIGDDYAYATLLAEHAGAVAEEEGGMVVPLYRSPTLTDKEREAVRFSVTAALPETEKLGGVVGELCRMHAATLRGLLERVK